MLGKNQKQPNGDGADGDHSNSGSGHNDPLPPLYWSVFHHQNLHADAQRQEFKAQEEHNNNKTNNAPANSETSPLVRTSTSSCSSHKRWGRVKDAVKTNELFIRYTSGIDDEGNKDEHKSQRWSDLISESYELTLRECLFLFIALLAMGDVIDKDATSAFVKDDKVRDSNIT